MSLKTKLDVYPLENYTVVNAESVKKHKTPFEKLMGLKARCAEERCVNSVEGVLIVHLRRHPHILLLKQSAAAPTDGAGNRRIVAGSTTSGEATYRLPGGRCRRGESEEACLLRKLGRQLLGEEKNIGVNAEQSTSDSVVEVGRNRGLSKASMFFRVGDVLGKWYRPHFSPLMYPYIPPHISVDNVKEVRVVLLVQLESTVYFNLLESNTQLVAVPLFDLYDNANKYGPIIASLPTTVSRVLFNYCSGDY